MIILGIDPGTTRVGYGVLEKNKGLNFIGSGMIGEEGASKYDRLLVVAKGMEKILKEYNPDVVAIEEVFFSKNRKTAISVSEARGVLMHQCHKKGFPIKEYGPSDIKAAVCGAGNASKKDVQRAVSMTFKDIEVEGPDDEWDAIAIAMRASFDVRNGKFLKA